jgi:D-alanyl-D-alanine carboxypeptidase
MLPRCLMPHWRPKSLVLFAQRDNQMHQRRDSTRPCDAAPGLRPVPLGLSAARSHGSGTRLLASVLTLVLSALLAPAAALADRYAAIVVDANTGDVLLAEKADEQRYPASLTKMMTLYLVFERLEQGRLRPDTRVRVSETAADAAPSKLGLEAGSTIALGDAVRALITKSANDVAVAIAEHIGGSQAAFAELMTRKAVELGMRNTIFRNPHGLPDGGQTTTARDMALLGLRLYDHFPIQSRLFSLRSFSYAGRTHRNHNTMLGNFPGMDGLKTGYTRQSGFNLVASVRRDGRHVIATVLGGQTAAARNARMRVVLNRTLPRASTVRTRKPTPFRGTPLASAGEHRDVEPRAGAAAPRLLEPVRLARRPYPADTRAEQADWRSTVRLAAPIPGATSTADLLGATPPSPAPALRPAIDDTVQPPPVRVTTVRSIDIRPAAVVSEPSPGRPPSTLQAQAQRLAAASATQTATAASLPSIRTPSRGPTAEIQIGAFATETEARQRLETARAMAAGILGPARAATPTVTVGGRRLYRARLTGFDPPAAARACAELRRRQIDCLVARAE